jgi:hypothetical protein
MFELCHIFEGFISYLGHVIVSYTLVKRHTKFPQYLSVEHPTMKLNVIPPSPTLYALVMSSLNFTNSCCGSSSADRPPTQTTDGAASPSTSARTDTVYKIILQWKAHTYKEFCKEHISPVFIPVFVNSCGGAKTDI